MAQIGVSLRGGAAVLHGGGDPSAALRAILPTLPPGAPVVVLIHGYRFDPDDADHDPHRLLFAPVPARACRKLGSWPRGLGFGDGPGTGLAIGFGWQARAAHLPALLRQGRTGFAEVYARAAEAGGALAKLIGTIAAIAPGRRVDIMAHSLGARVALSALPALEPGAAGAVGRILLLGGAEFAGRAVAALDASAARPGIYSITARHNDPYDALFEAVAPGGPGADHALSRGVLGRADWLTLQLDAPAFRDWAALRGIALDAGGPAICHWSFYTREGALDLYARILRERGAWTLPHLRGVPALSEHQPRWSRLGLPALPLPALPRPLPRRARGL